MFVPHSRGCLSDDLRRALSDTVDLGGGGGGDLSDDLVHLRRSLSDLGGGLSDAMFVPHSRGCLSDDLRRGLSDTVDLEGGGLSNTVFLPHSGGGGVR